MQSYELMVIYKPQLVGEDQKKTLESVEKLIKAQKGEIVEADDWGEKSLAYLIEGHERGYYVVYTIRMDPGKVAGLQKKMKLQKSLLRYMIITTDQQATEK